MRAQPGRQALSRALGQQVEDLMILQIDQDGPIALPPPPRPLIHANDPGRGSSRCGGCLHEPQQGGRTCCEAQAGCQAASKRCASRTVWRAQGAATVGRRSVKMRRGHWRFGQNHLRTRSGHRTR